MPRFTKKSSELSLEDTPPISAADTAHQPSEPAVSPKPVKKRSRIRRNLLILLVTVAAIGVAGTVYFYTQYETLKKNPNAEQQAEVKSLTGQVGKLILLPSETPTVATVLDKSALKDQPFFVNAVDGDKVLVFVNAREAILYRPSSNKIINVAPLYFQDTSGGGTGTAPTGTGADRSGTVSDTSSDASASSSSQ